MNQFREFIKKAAERSQLLKSYWNKSPTAKIVVINVGVYVTIISCSLCGRWDSFPKTLWSRTSPANALTSQRDDSTLSSHTPSHIWASSVLVINNPFSVRPSDGGAHGQSHPRSWQQVYLLAVRTRYPHGRHHQFALPETFSIYPASSGMLERHRCLPHFFGHAQPSGLLLPVLLPSEGLDVGCHVGFLLLGLRPPEEILFRHHSRAYNLPDEKSEFFVISQSFNSL